MWIRSQNKELLIKCNDIAIENNQIIGYFDKETEYENLGTYKSKERAIEVLDEIQELISNLSGRDSYQYYPIYQMPEE